MTAQMFFGTTSRTNLIGVDPTLIAIDEKALYYSQQDFGFPSPNCRTIAQEQALIAKGESHTLKSHHIPPPSPGKGSYYKNPQTGVMMPCSGANDAVPYSQGRSVWDWNLIYIVWAAFKIASTEAKTQLTWGGVWDKTMDQYADPHAEMNEYIIRQRALGNQHPFVDGPHFELGVN
jgi:hypothetical protein